MEPFEEGERVFLGEIKRLRYILLRSDQEEETDRPCLRLGPRNQGEESLAQKRDQSPKCP